MVSKEKISKGFEPSPIQAEYKEHYNKEMDKRIELNNAINMPVGIITMYAGVIYFLFDNIITPLTCFGIFQITMLIIILGIIIWVIYSLARVYLRITYAYYATPQENKKYYQELIKYHDSDEKKAEIDLLNNIYDKYAEAATFNADVNTYRSSNLYRAKLLIVWLIPMIIIAGLVQLVESFNIIKG